MRYSVGNRFRGTLLGALVGKSLASSKNKQLPNCWEIEQTAVVGMESLIALGRLDLNDWRSRQQETSAQAITDNCQVEVILATLPVSLFFHENLFKLRQNLLQVLEIWEDNPVVRDGTLAVGYAIAQILTEKFHPHTLIEEIIAFIGDTQTSVPQQLLKVNTLLAQGAGLEIAQIELNREDKHSNAIAMAFYCFLSTLEDYRLSVLRTIEYSNIWQPDYWRLHSYNISAITGALSGAYNSNAGIPVGWQILYSQANSVASGLGNFSATVELADGLVAVWSGLYNFALDSRQSSTARDFMSEPETFPPSWEAITQSSRHKSDNQSGATPLCVYAAPRVIRSR
jgi:ADP-ribosylglycohydrolase